MSTENLNKSHLQELSGSDYENADGQPDIRGWDVKDESGNKIGKIKELLFDESSLKVRYIITKLKSENDDVDGRKVLVPVGIARLHENDDDVILPAVTSTLLQSLPEYEKDNLTSVNEHTIRNAFAGIGGASLAGTALTQGNDDFYSHYHFNEDNLYNSRTGKPSSPLLATPDELLASQGKVEQATTRLRPRFVEDQYPVNKDTTEDDETMPGTTRTTDFDFNKNDNDSYTGKDDSRA